MATTHEFSPLHSSRLKKITSGQVDSRIITPTTIRFQRDFTCTSESLITQRENFKRKEKYSRFLFSTVCVSPRRQRFDLINRIQFVRLYFFFNGSLRSREPGSSKKKKIQKKQKKITTVLEGHLRNVLFSCFVHSKTVLQP